MQFQFSFKHMETSAALQTYAEDKIREKVEKFVTKAIDASVFFTVTRHMHTCHVHLLAGDGFSLDVQHTSADMYATIDEIVHKLESQLKKHKEKLKDHGKGTKLVQALASLPTIEAEPAVDAAEILKYEANRKHAAGR